MSARTRVRDPKNAGMGRPPLPEGERAVRVAAVFLLPREEEKLRAARGLGPGASLAPSIASIVREWISRHT
jgi:hypothetical protein